MEKCYICRKALFARHPNYNRLCETCGNENLANRTALPDLSGYIAVVTGARIKIGFHTALMLLRTGASVVATSRFPFHTMSNYAKQPDYDQWKDRLTICQMDLKSATDLELFLEYFCGHFSSLDILINNAAQTVKKSREYYEQLEQEERREYNRLGGSLERKPIRLLCEDQYQISDRRPQDMLGITETDSYNAWVAKPGDISLYELLEVQIINSTAPFMLCTRLKPALDASSHSNRFVINVSSMEGCFSEKRKSDKHLHTNMAKASLNMLTKSLGASWARDRVFVYSVDPGWVSNQFPKLWDGVCGEDFLAPLTYEDAAARILHPVFQFYKADYVNEYGILYKNYKRQEW